MNALWPSELAATLVPGTVVLDARKARLKLTPCGELVIFRSKTGSMLTSFARLTGISAAFFLEHTSTSFALPLFTSCSTSSLTACSASSLRTKFGLIGSKLWTNALVTAFSCS